MRVFRRAEEVRTRVEPPLGFLDHDSRTRFADVAGLDHVIAELRDVVDYIADPARFERLDARPPRGILLHGEPGCGKTLLARALASEVGVPFYFVSATSFVERFVGLGASRVRELFETAGADAPCIVFLDELDAAGRRRSDGDGDREFDHTLNQLLVELDGFLNAPGVVTIAATNRPELLDPALIRPGRFDRKIRVPLPNSDGRLAVLRLHAASRPGAADLDWATVAAKTEGRSPAELANLVNEAALLAVRGQCDVVRWDHVEAALGRLDAWGIVH
jgi:cell division protease FtsH